MATKKKSTDRKKSSGRRSTGILVVALSFVSLNVYLLFSFQAFNSHNQVTSSTEEHLKQSLLQQQQQPAAASAKKGLQLPIDDAAAEQSSRSTGSIVKNNKPAKRLPFDTNTITQADAPIYPFSSIPKNPRCLVKFRNKKQLFCHSGAHLMQVVPRLVRHLLEHYFPGCSAAHIGVQNISYVPALRFDWQCLFAFEADHQDLMRGGDDYWGPVVGDHQLTKNMTLHSIPQQMTAWSREQIICTLVASGEAFCDNVPSLPYEARQLWNASFPYHLFTTIPHNTSNAVVLLGNLRGGEQTWQTLYDNVLDVNNANLILVTVGRTPPEQRTSSLYQRAKFVAELPYYDDWADAIDLIVRGNQTWRTTVPKAIGSTSILLGRALGKTEGSGALIFMARWFLMNHMQQFQFHDLYDRFVVTRSDHYYKCQHDLGDLVPANHIYVPNGQDWKGLCDRHFVASAEHVYAALNLLPPLIRNPEHYAHLPAPGFHPLATTETFLRLRWGEDGLFPLVRRFARPMFTCAVPGDNFLWTAPFKDTIPEGVLVKYKLEYALAKSECLQSHISKNTDPALVADDFKTPPKGVLLKATVNSLGGWACDMDDPFSTIQVRFVVNDTLHGNTMVIQNVANMYATKFIRKQCGGGIYHRISVDITLPESYVDAAEHNRTIVRAWAIDLLDPAVTTELTHSPTIMKMA